MERGALVNPADLGSRSFRITFAKLPKRGDTFTLQVGEVRETWRFAGQRRDKFFVARGARIIDTVLNLAEAIRQDTSLRIGVQVELAWGTPTMIITDN
jgi:hypothetical protein